MNYHNKYIKNGLIFLFAIFIVFWSIRIWHINQTQTSIEVYEMGEDIECGDLSIRAIESMLLTKEELQERFDLPIDAFSYSQDDGIVIVVHLSVTNTSSAAIEWDDVFNSIDCGFESSSWGSSNCILYGQYINCFYSPNLEPGTSQDIWFSTDVSRQCFKEKTWNQIETIPFYYVLTLDPYKVEIRLNT